MGYQNGVGGGRVLSSPCKIIIERLFSTVGLAARFKFSLNGVQVCAIKYKELGEFTTSYELNTLTIKGGWIGKEMNFTAHDGGTIKIYNLGGAFLPERTEYYPPDEHFSGGAQAYGQPSQAPQHVHTSPVQQPPVQQPPAQQPSVQQPSVQQPHVQSRPAAQALFCASCGTKFPDGALFCSNCGAKRS